MEQGTIKHETCYFPFTYQHEKLPVFQDYFASLLQPPTKEVYIVFKYYGFWVCYDLHFLHRSIC